MEDTKEAKPTPAGLIALSWLLVGIPMLWGVWQTVQKSRALFQ